MKCGLNADGVAEYQYREVEQLGLVSLLLEAGFTVDMAKAYIKQEEAGKIRVAGGTAMRTALFKKTDAVVGRKLDMGRQAFVLR